MGTDASLVEINPLVVTDDGRRAGPGRQDQLRRQRALPPPPSSGSCATLDEEEPLEVEAGKYGLNYIKLDGNVGCMVNGAGLAMATMDIIKHHGGSPANFLDVGGGASREKVADAFKILLADRDVRAVLINIFGGIMRCDVVAEGVVAAARAVGVKVPVVVRLEGTNVERAADPAGVGAQLQVADGMKDAAREGRRAGGGEVVGA